MGGKHVQLMLLLWLNPGKYVQMSYNTAVSLDKINLGKHVRRAMMPYSSRWENM